MRKMIICLINVFVVMCGVNADIIRVPQDYPTIQSGINASQNGDTVLVSAGTYTENINFSGKEIDVVAESGSTATIIDGQHGGSVVTFDNGETTNSVLRNFTIRFGAGSGSPSYKGGGITCEGSSPTIKDNVIWSNTAIRGGGIYMNDSSPIISCCVIIDNDATYDGGAIYIRTSSGPSVTPRIFNCLMTGNDADYGGGVFTYQASPEIINCTIDSNTGAQFSGGIYCMAESQATIQNCLITNSILGHGIYALDAESEPIVEYSDVWQNEGGNYGGFAGPGTGCMSENPLYVVGYSGQHYLSQIASGQGQNSPCLNSGNTAASDLGLDLYTTRTDHATDIELVDIGYHYVPVTLPTSTPTRTPTRTPTPSHQPSTTPTPTPPPPTFTPTFTPNPEIIRIPQDYTTIQAGINAASDGDIVLVAIGTYYETINFIGKDILVKSESGADKTIIHGNDSGTVVTFNSQETNNAILREFSIQNGYGSTSKGGGISITGGSSPTIEGCFIFNNASIKGGGFLIDGQDSDPIIQFNRINDNSTQYGDGAGLYVSSQAEPYIFSNLIIHNVSDYGGGLFVTEANPRIVNNTIHQNSGSSYGGGLYFLSATAEVTNNIIVNQISGEGIYVYEDSFYPQLLHNDIWNNAGGNFGGAAQQGPTDLNVNPLFASGPNGDFYLSNVQAGQTEHSMCIDTGYYEAYDIGLNEYSTRTDHQSDENKSDLGFHYGYEPMYTPSPTPSATPTCIIDSRLWLNQEIFYPGDRFYMYVRLLNTCSEMIYVDQVIMLDVYGAYWFWPGWTEDFDYQPVKMPLYIEIVTIFDFTWPEINGSAFDLRFWAAAFETDHIDIDHLVGIVNYVEFGYATNK